MTDAASETDPAAQVPSMPPMDPVAERFMNLSDLVTPNAMRVAATLRLADLVRDGVSTVDDLAAKSGANGSALGELMQHLAQRGVFQEVERDTYGPTEISAWLEGGHPAGMRDFLDLNVPMARAQTALADLLTSVRTGEPAYPRLYGRTFWEDLAANPELSGSFNARMARQVAEIARETAQVYDWSDVNRVVDVGGGNGALLHELLSTHAHLRATLVDLPAPAEEGGRRLADAGLADRVDVVPGSFFEPVPTGGDVYVLSTVLHDWNDESCVAILTQCARAAGENGRVLVIESLVTDEYRRMVASVNLIMLATLGGRERSLDEYAELAAQAGLRLHHAAKQPSLRSIIEFRRA